MQQPFIIIKGKACAHKIKNIEKRVDGGYDVEYVNGGKIYTYKKPGDVVVLEEHEEYNPADWQVYVKDRPLYDITHLTAFPQDGINHWRITYKSGCVKDYLNDRIEIWKNIRTEKKVADVLDYLKAVADTNPLGTEKETDEIIEGNTDGEKVNILTRQYNNIFSIDKTLAVAPYIYPQEVKVATIRAPEPIFPFGCNASQKRAVKEAFAHQLSVIQGPPGTGKTQTILNIIANIIMLGKTVMVVSNNNSATANVKEKLKDYELDFIAASLGSKKNKEAFVKEQPEVPGEVETWEINEDERSRLRGDVRHSLERLVKVFEQQELRAKLRLELQSLLLEQNHFITEQNIVAKVLPNVSADAQTIMSVWIQTQAMAEEVEERANGFFGRIIAGVTWWWRCRKIRRLLHVRRIERNNLRPFVIELQKFYYHQRISEVNQEIEDADNYLKEVDEDGLLEGLKKDSMCLFKDRLCGKYKGMEPFTLEDAQEISRRFREFCDRYPVVLSTTYSARTSVPHHVYDYIIMDEASQVSVDTGALALTCAKNAVIVGDTKQLPNVVKGDIKVKLNKIYDGCKDKVDKGYDGANFSFLESVCKVVPDVCETLLREHYRCHPRIINFCNQKFYGGSLLIMTEDKGEKDVLSVTLTGKDNFARNHCNQREIDVIKKEVLHSLPENPDFGVITPYNNQVDAINSQLGDIASTVHKYQGREKKIIIFSTVDDQITEFVDDPNMLNVAVSRAKDKFWLVVTGQKQKKPGNITDFIEYIRYNNCSVTESKLHSIYHLLAKQKSDQLTQTLKESDKVSEHPTEVLTNNLIKKILEEHKEWGYMGVACHYSLCTLIRDKSLMNKEEDGYASNPNTHLDFLIYSLVTKRPVLAIEVDGITYHQKNTRQYERDQMKNSILDKYGIPIVRLRTDGYGEEEKIIETMERALKVGNQRESLGTDPKINDINVMKKVGDCRVQ